MWIFKELQSSMLNWLIHSLNWFWTQFKYKLLYWNGKSSSKGRVWFVGKRCSLHTPTMNYSDAELAESIDSRSSNLNLQPRKGRFFFFFLGEHKYLWALLLYRQYLLSRSTPQTLLQLWLSAGHTNNCQQSWASTGGNSQLKNTCQNYREIKQAWSYLMRFAW